MRQSFDNSMPWWEQRARLRTVRVSTGHKHMHTAGPGKKAEKATRAATHLLRQRKKARERFGAQVRAYFEGRRDNHP